MSLDMSLQAPLWRSIAVFRFASLAYAAVLLVIRHHDYAHWGWAWAVVAAMTAWTVVSTLIYASPARRTWLLLGADLALTVLALLSTAVLQTPAAASLGVMPVTATWLAGPALAWAVVGGPPAGAVAAAVIAGGTVWLRHEPIGGVYESTALDGPVILLIAAMAVGYVSTLASRAEQALQRATEIEAASRERERLARTIHDSVLQVLAMVQRWSAEAGGEAAEIGRLAGEQGTALRALVTGNGPAAPTPDRLDLSACLSREASALISVITPADPVILTERAVTETAAAVRAAIDNVRQHCGATAKAWVLIDDEGRAVSVTVRDDGPGIPAGRLAEAAAEGRLGVSHAIIGRIRDLGGSADISSTPGGGTEVRLRVPRAWHAV
jgi:signal transduction histidine kinase